MPLDVETPLSPSYGGLPTNVKTYPFPVLLTIPSDIETDVERLVEVRFLLECLCTPRSCAIKIRDVVPSARTIIDRPMEEELKPVRSAPIDRNHQARSGCCRVRVLW